MLADDGLVHRTIKGWVASRGQLVEAYLDRYRPREIEPEAWWYSLDTLSEQARRIVDCYQRVVVSADLATDLTTPWRRPSVAIVWTPSPLDLDAMRFVRAESRAVATVIVRTTDDLRMLSDIEVVDGLPIASRLQQATDLLDLGGSDRVEAAEVVMRRGTAAS